MKRLFFLVCLPLMAALLLSACSIGRMFDPAYTKIASNQSGYYAAESGGYTSPSEYLDIKVKESRLKNIETINEKQNEYVEQGDLKKAQEIQDLKDRQIQSRNGRAISGETVKLKVENRSKYIVEILSSPYDGLTLNPGETTETLSVPVGKYDLKYEVHPIGQNSPFHISATVSVPKYRKNNILIADK